MPLPASFFTFSQPSNLPSLFSPFPEPFQADRNCCSVTLVMQWGPPWWTAIVTGLGLERQPPFFRTTFSEIFLLYNLSLSQGLVVKTGFWLNLNYNLCKIKFSSLSSLSLPPSPSLSLSLSHHTHTHIMTYTNRHHHIICACTHIRTQVLDDIAQDFSDVGASFGQRSSRLCWCLCRFWMT